MHVISCGGKQDQVLVCQARGRLKKERKAIYAGDLVELDEINLVEDSAVITKLLPRKTLITRPTLANVDQVVIVQAVKQPDFSQIGTDRYLVFFQLNLDTIRPLLCFNKCDLVPPEELERLRKIYEPLGYFVIFVSAKTLEGIDKLKSVLLGKTSVFAGPSGVGKSSLLNEILPDQFLKVGRMNNDFGVGRHTTTASELYRMKDSSDLAVAEEFFQETADSVLLEEENHAALQKGTWIADTPGFNLYDFEHPRPQELAFQFPEIEALAPDCRFANCLHYVEAGCAVLMQLKKLEELKAGQEIISEEVSAQVQGKEMVRESGEALCFEPGGGDRELRDFLLGRAFVERYASYLAMLNESLALEEAQKSVSKKKEATVKFVGGEKATKAIPRLGNRYRLASRNTEKQRLKGVEENED